MKIATNLLIGWLLSLALAAQGQNITRIEYFIDNDPGFGSGTAVSITASASLTNTFSLSFPTGLSSGFHLLTVRARDANNQWSTVGIRPFFKESLPATAPANIVAMEYFTDNDPGYGLGTSVGLTSGTALSGQTFAVPLSVSLTAGFHFLTVRARDVNSQWSVVAIRPFFKEIIPTPTIPNIVAMEYFVDADPGFGSGSAVSITPGNNVNQNFTVALSSAIPNGFHTLTVRARDANNQWSEIAVRPFFKETLPTSASANIVAIEYFVDADPGFGSGTAITGFTLGTAVSRAITIGLGSVATGAHTLTIRAKDANGNWGVVGIRDFFVQDNLIITNGIPASSCRSTAFTIQFTASGNYTAGNVFTALLSDASGSFANPTTLGSVSGTASGVISATVPGGVAVGSGYQVRVVSSAPAITNSPLTALEITALCQCLLNASLMSGNWSTPGIWSCGRVPVVTDPVRISAGHTVAVDINNAIAKSLSLWGGLQYQAGSKLRIEP